MSNFDTILANIKLDFEKYDAAGLINEEKLYQDAIRATKRFGNDMSMLYDQVLEVNNGKAELPRNFQSLELAYKCEPIGYKTEAEEKELQYSSIYLERVTNTAYWSECSSCCEENKESIISENVYLKSGNKVTFYYDYPTIIRLTRSPITKKWNCQAQCKNKFVGTEESPYTMRIEGEYLQTNFEQGHIFFRYYGVPLDEDGNIDVPSSPSGRMEEYVELHLKRKLIERLLINSDAQSGISSMFPVIQQQEQIALRNAANELKMMKLTPQHLKKFVRQNRLETLRYEVFTRW